MANKNLTKTKKPKKINDTLEELTKLILEFRDRVVAEDKFRREILGEIGS